MEWRWGINQFATARKILPKIIPKEVTQGPPRLMAGRTKLKEVAPSIIPAEKPRRPSIIFRGTFFRKKAGIAPNPVANPAPRLPSTPNHIRFIFFPSLTLESAPINPDPVANSLELQSDLAPLMKNVISSPSSMIIFYQTIPFVVSQAIRMIGIGSGPVC
jgi:hypothetical protein